MAHLKKGQYKRKKMKEYPEFDRPRKKLLKRGVQALSLLELMAVIVGSGNQKIEVYTIAKQLAKLIEQDFNGLSVKNLEAIKGIGESKACQIIAALEVSKRFLIKNYKNVLPLVEELKGKKQEYFLTLTLDGAHNLIEKRIVFIGTLNESLVHPREVFADAITDRAASIIFVHNHTSDDTTPSTADIQITKRLLEVASTIGIEVLDHIIITRSHCFSFKDNGLF